MEAVVSLKKSPIAPRKMRLVANLVKGLKAGQAFAILKYEPKSCAIYLEKLLLAAIASWQNKNPSTELEVTDLYIKSIRVDSAGMLKRLKPAPQGRAHRIRKRYNHVTLVVDGSPSTQLIKKEEIAEMANNTTKMTIDGTKN